MALVVYEPPAYTPLTSPTRIFDLPHSGRVTMTQHWQENGTRTGGAVWDAAQVLGHYLDEHHTRWMNRSSLEVRPLWSMRNYCAPSKTCATNSRLTTRALFGLLAVACLVRWLRSVFRAQLGAGLGYASIVASRCGFTRVWATDGDANVIPFARSNANDNLAKGMRVEALQWNDSAALQQLLPSSVAAPDVILASDVIYIGSTEAWGSFLTLVATLCRRRRSETAAAVAADNDDATAADTADAASPSWAVARHDGTSSAAGDPLVLLSHTRRYANEEAQFFRQAKRERFEVTPLPESALHATWAATGRSVLYELTWRGDPAV